MSTDLCLIKVASSLSQEFELRRTMMFTRLGATLQSFSWWVVRIVHGDRSMNRLLFIPRSSKIGGKLPNLIADQISSTTTNFLSEKLLLGLPDVLAAREDLVSFMRPKFAHKHYWRFSTFFSFWLPDNIDQNFIRSSRV